ncbi:ATP-grasp domain-containing protein [Salinicoccus sesuvii]|uniref:ATP-grasp domain-containing protein n=1 Tax=Salinicoccus sesuvii TaxID=868281 RepID=A0ABV7N7N6_9STAP
MDTNNIKWLDHLEEAIPHEGYGNRLSMYLIALEAWRRGITVNFFTIDNPENKLLIRYSLEFNGRVHRFESSMGDMLSKEAYDVCDYKDLTKKYLSDAGVKVPKGEVFSTSASEAEILEFANSLSFPIVVKPLNENAGKGVFSNVYSEQNLLDVVDYLKTELGYRHIIIEEFISGNEYRMLTVDGKLVGAVNRVPANIVGNGKDSIETLIRVKNRSKSNNPAISKKRIQLDKEVLHEIERKGYTKDSVLENGEQLFLRAKSNISAGGDPVDITDDISEEMKSIAEEATKAIPGLKLAGLDFIVDPETKVSTVIEINTKPMLGLHVFPIKGKARDVVAPIIDLYFPETINTEKSSLFFDFNDKIAPLDHLTVKEVTVSPLEKANVGCSREFIIEQEKNQGNLLKETRLQALKLGVHGFIKKVETDRYNVVAACENDKIMEEFKSFFYRDTEEFGILEVEEQEWHKPIKAGFTIKKETISEIEDKLKKEEKKTSRLTSKIGTLEEKLELEQSETQKKQQEVAHLNEAIESLKRELQELKEANVEVTLKLGETERAFVSTKHTLTEKLETFKREHAKLTRNYEDVLNSKSWKITKPLRRFNR